MESNVQQITALRGQRRGVVGRWQRTATHGKGIARQGYGIAPLGVGVAMRRSVLRRHSNAPYCITLRISGTALHSNGNVGRSPASQGHGYAEHGVGTAPPRLA